MTFLENFNLLLVIAILLFIRTFAIKRKVAKVVTDILTIVTGFIALNQQLIGLNYSLQNMLVFILAGVIVYQISTMLTLSLAIVNQAIVKNYKYLGRRYFRVFSLHLLTASFEEFVWRFVYLISLSRFCGQVVASIVVSILFTYCHKYRFSNKMQAFELFMFSILLCSLFLNFNSIILVITIHLVRNILVEIANFEAVK